jgi:hypothetical protein
MPPELIHNIAAEVQLFNTLEQKENFLFILGALTARLISLKKAAETLNLEPETFIKILELMGFLPQNTPTTSVVPSGAIADIPH